MFRIVEADEEVRADTHQLPEEVHLEDVGSHHQAQHRHREEREESVETLEALLVALFLIVLVTLSHIAKAIDMNHERHRRDDDEHHHRDWRQAEADVESQQLRELHPCEIEDRHSGEESVSASAYDKEIFISRIKAHSPQHTKHCSADDTGNGLLHLHTEQPQEQEAQEWKEKNQKCITVFHCLMCVLEFHVFNAVHLVTMIVTVNIDDNSQGNSCLCSADTYREEREESSLKLSGEEQAVEDCKVQIDGVQHQLYGDEHSHKVAVCDKAKHANEEKQRTDC